MDKAWKKFWDDLYKNMPDHTSAPTEGPFYRGDICKINGRAHIWLGDQWRDALDMETERFNIQVKFP